MNTDASSQSGSLSSSASAPLVSVVMSVFNGAERLTDTLESVLGQTDVALELIVVDDGSTDATAEILRRHAEADSRLIVISQRNTGLTRALIAGCERAKGQFIARQDADDLALPGRIRAQAEYLLQHPEVVAVAGGVRFVAPQGEVLFEVIPPTRLVIDLHIDRIKTPPLVAAMFRRASYLECGGFRPRFVVAQDVDLWLRLEEVGPCHGIEDVYYEARMTVAGISSSRRGAQLELARLAIECARQRRGGNGDIQVLEESVRLPARVKAASNSTRADFYYFLGACLRRRNAAAARRYFRQALALRPFHFRALISWLATR